MNTKIKELTENIYQEGVAKARKEADRILAEANEQAEKTISEAKEKAASNLAEARQEAEMINTALREELQLVSQQVVEMTKQHIADLVTVKTSRAASGILTGDPHFLKDLVLRIASSWSAAGGNGHLPEILVPESEAGRMDKLVRTQASHVLTDKLVIKPVPELKSGFQIVNKQDNYKISFTDEDFEGFFYSLMKPKVKEFLFNTNEA